MKFVNPGWLWGLLALPLLYLFLLWDVKVRQARMERFAERAVWLRISPEMDWSQLLRKGRIWLAATAFAILALARPQWGKHEEIVQVTGLDIIIALDVSNSMEVEDVSPSRSKKAKHLIRSFLDRLGGDRVGVVAFAGSAYLATPLTTDLGYVAETIDILGPKMVTNQGTDIGFALETAARALERGAEEGEKKAGDDSLRSRVVILISDGEDHRKGAIDEAKLLGTSGAKVYVLGIGTEKGGPIPTRDDSGQLFGYKRTRKGDPVISGFKPDALKKIAKEAGGRYWPVTASETEIDEILADVGALDRTEFSEKRKVTYEDRFQIPLMIALLLFLIELSVPARRLKKVPAKAAAAPAALFPLSFAVSLLSFAVSLLSFAVSHLGFASGPALAVEGPSWQAPRKAVDVWSKTKKGVEAFTDGKDEEAQKNFEEAQSLDPSKPELLFNQGVVQGKKGDAEAAVLNYGQAAEMAREQGNGQVAAGAQYNLGNALARKGDFANALKLYLNALDESKKANDPALESDIRKNIELLRKQKQEQQKKQSPDQKDQAQNPNQEKSKEQKSSDEEKQEQEKKNQQAKQDQKKDQGKPENKPGQYQQPGKRQFKSEKLTPEDANRVMDELAGKERELQARLKKQKGQPQTTERDW